MINRKWRRLFSGIIVSVMIIAWSINYNTTGILTFKVATDPTFLPFSYQAAHTNKFTKNGSTLSLQNYLSQ